MKTLKKIWLVVIGFLISKKIETPEANTNVPDIVEEDPQQRIFRLQEEQKKRAEETARNEKWRTEREEKEMRKKALEELAIKYSQEILCAKELLKENYTPLSSILFNGGIPPEYLLIKRKRKIFQTGQEMGKMKLSEVGLDEKSWTEKTDYRLVPKSIAGVLLTIIGYSQEKMDTMPSIVKEMFYSENEYKHQMHVEGPMYHQVIKKTRSKYFIMKESDIQEFIENLEKELEK